ncbi:hypothetical protein NCER_100403 [Vairimorpha ceranae BRL01]|uniref:Homeobox domain-containing protein n=2 Tax=Vairimorpha ceranae TaxID=40302 RepID=C4V7H4_VAIC1|nr:zinc finger domain-containing protein [Vairimorpha ceranae]EEQ82830.1 hypothetical protein NCER_100403 [Vairimorpha ceranae BRL01]KAF5139885.1 hypothetical protein G9O61_00g019570 [Vairimorpha ceranae]KKO75055.1 zinc finger domain-containing protein [Vairimorpha ceranae]
MKNGNHRMNENNKTKGQKPTDNKDDYMMFESDGDDVPIINRRVRTVMSPYQSKILHECFCKNPFPSTELREELSRVLKMKPRTIQIWFQNQRQKSKNVKDHMHPWHSEYKNMPYRSLNILATVAVAKLYERRKEIEKIEEN